MMKFVRDLFKQASQSFSPVESVPAPSSATMSKDQLEYIDRLQQKLITARSSSSVLLLVVVTVALFCFFIGIGTYFTWLSYRSSVEHTLARAEGYVQFYRLEQYLYKVYPYLQSRPVEINALIRDTWEYATILEVNPYTQLARQIWESEGFVHSNDKTIGKAGEIGWNQIMPSTAALFSLTPDDLRRPG